MNSTTPPGKFCLTAIIKDGTFTPLAGSCWSSVSDKCWQAKAVSLASDVDPTQPNRIRHNSYKKKQTANKSQWICVYIITVIVTLLVEDCNRIYVNKQWSTRVDVSRMTVFCVVKCGWEKYITECFRRPPFFGLVIGQAGIASDGESIPRNKKRAIQSTLTDISLRLASN